MFETAAFSKDILLTWPEGSTGRVSARDQKSRDRAVASVSYKKDRDPIFSQCCSKQGWLRRESLHGYLKANVVGLKTPSSSANTSNSEVPCEPVNLFMSVKAQVKTI